MSFAPVYNAHSRALILGCKLFVKRLRFSQKALLWNHTGSRRLPDKEFET